MIGAGNRTHGIDAGSSEFATAPRRDRPRRLASGLCGVLLLAGFLLPAATRGAILRVRPGGNDGNSGDSWATARSTVAATLLAAAANDEIWVAAGLYFERITLKPFVALYGGFAGNEAVRDERNWTVNLSILDGSSAGTVVGCEQIGAGPGMRLDGFVVQNGRGVMKGGITLVGCSPVIANNLIRNNTSEGEGGGIHCASGANALIVNNTIIQNTALGGYGDGGGICALASSPTIAGNIIARNSATQNGGGICCRQETETPTVIRNNLIAENLSCLVESMPVQAVDPLDPLYPSFYYRPSVGAGGIAAIYGSAPRILNNTIVGNSGLHGGGILVYDCVGNAEVVNNTICGNNGAGVRWAGQPIFTSSAMALRNNIVHRNSIGLSRWAAYPGSACVIANNCIQGNDADYDGLTGQSGLNGNFDIDPRLAALAYGDLHLQPGSPCIGTGDNTAIEAGWTDQDGQPRILGGIVDVGSDESDGTVWSGAPRVLRVSPIGNDALGGDSWATAKRTLPAALSALHDPALTSSHVIRGGEIWLRTGDYSGSALLPPFVHLYGGFAGTETTRDQRLLSATERSVLRGGKSARTLLIAGGHRVSTVDGFDVTDGYLNGAFDQGGGIECFLAGPVVVRNRIYGNIAPLGAGIGDFAGTAWFADNEIVDNKAADDGFGVGGGIHGKFSMSVIERNTIRNNIASDGAGIYMQFGRPWIRDNLIADNTQQGIHLQNSDVLLWSSRRMEVTGNRITGNTTSSEGGGIYCLYCSGWIANNIVAGNRSGIFPAGGGYGGGLSITAGSETHGPLHVLHNTVVGNVADYLGLNFGGGMNLTLFNVPNLHLAHNIVAFNSSGINNNSDASPPYVPANPTLVANDVFQNADLDYQTGLLGLAQLPHPSDLHLDPLFADAAGGDYRLQADSSCIDAGSTLYPLDRALDGLPRPLDGNADGVALADLGCFEFLDVHADTDQDRVLDGDEVNQYGSNPVLRDTDGDGMEDGDEVAAGTDLTNRVSCLRMVSAARDPGSDEITVSWQSVTGKTYRVERSTNLLLAAASGFGALQTNVPGQPGITVITDAAGAASGPFSYRVKIVP